MSQSVSPPVADPEILAERAFLTEAREALRRMHHEVVSTETVMSDSEDSDEVYQNTVYRMVRNRRARALVDLPDVPLFFGRLDFEPGAVASGERLYVGRRHVHDGSGDPLVVDWRAGVSTAFYRASRQDPQGVRRRRRYGFSESAELTAFEDEILAGTARPEQVSALVEAEIERPRSGPMRDIVATIQPEQDDLVRALPQPSLCVQGAPGTGKTAVGLHRLAYLLYSARDQLGNGVAVVGPNRSFLTYIRRVLPALGEVDVTQTTVQELVRRPVTRSEPEESWTEAVKGDARMAAVLHRALWSQVGTCPADLVYVRGSVRYRVAREVVDDVLAGGCGTRRYHAARATSAQRLAHLVLLQMERRGIVTDDRDQNAVARSRPVTQLLNQVWPRLVPEQVLFRLLSDPAFLARAARDQLTAEEQQHLLWSRPYRSWRSARWSAADVVLLDELTDLCEPCSSLSHIVVDEAQDLSAMQCRALARRCSGGSFTVLGDLAQGTAPWAVDGWPELLEHLGIPDARLAVLDRGYRVPAQIIDFAARLLPVIAPGLGAPRAVRRDPGALRVQRTTAEDHLHVVTRTCREHLTRRGSVGVIVADADLPAVHRHLAAVGLEPALLGRDEDALEGGRLVCVPVTLAKGLEFDTVVVVEPARILAAEARGAQRLYVALTRAVTALDVVHTEPLPSALAAPDHSVPVTR
jgi:DNA helicase IV